MHTQDLEKTARRMRWDIIKMIGVDNRGHYGGSCSSTDIVAVLYFNEMKHDPSNPKWNGRDRFLFSKGHSVLAQYAALAESGYFPREELWTLKKLGSILQGHPEPITPGVEAVTGSLGQGLSIACGMAAGLKIDKSDSRVYCIMGDGEQAEGQIWEAAMAAVNFKLDNLCAFLDRNGLQAMGTTAERFPIENLEARWEAFGWSVQNIDGHDYDEIKSALDRARTVKGRPSLIIARTVKGKGIGIAENNVGFHNGSMTREQQEKALAELADELDIGVRPAKAGSGRTGGAE